MYENKKFISQSKFRLKTKIVTFFYPEKYFNFKFILKK